MATATTATDSGDPREVVNGGGGGFGSGGGGGGGGEFNPAEALGGFLSGNGKKLVFFGLLLAAAVTTYYQVEPDQVGLVTRFGKFERQAEPGPHLKLPFGVERVYRVPVQRQLKQEFGFETANADVNSEYKITKNARAEATMLTGDLNVATVEWIVQYKIRDPYKYLFKVRDVTGTFRDISETTMRQIVGDRSVTEVLTIGREEIQVRAKEELQDLCDRYDMGIEVLQLVLQDVNPPEPVKPSFNEVNEAIQEQQRKINEAKAQYNRVIPEAEGRAKQAMESAEGYASERVNRALGEVERFAVLQAEFERAPEVTRTRIYLETLAKVLPRAGSRIFLDAEAQGLLPLLNFAGATPTTTKKGAN